MVGNRVTTEHLLDVIREHGVNFDLTPERRTRLKAEKADDLVLDAVAKGRRR
jgi:hypothetical protein